MFIAVRTMFSILFTFRVPLIYSIIIKLAFVAYYKNVWINVVCSILISPSYYVIIIPVTVPNVLTEIVTNDDVYDPGNSTFIVPYVLYANPAIDAYIITVFWGSM